MEYRLGRIDLPPQHADYAGAYAQGFADGRRRREFAPIFRRLQPVDAREPAVLVAMVDRLARSHPEYVAYGNAPPGYREIGPGHYRRIGV